MSIPSFILNCSQFFHNPRTSGPSFWAFSLVIGFTPKVLQLYCLSFSGTVAFCRIVAIAKSSLCFALTSSLLALSSTEVKFSSESCLIDKRKTSGSRNLAIAVSKFVGSGQDPVTASSSPSCYSGSLVVCRERASALPCFSPGRWTTWKSNSCNTSINLYVIPSAFWRKSHCKLAWSVRSIKGISSK